MEGNGTGFFCDEQAEIRSDANKIYFRIFTGWRDIFQNFPFSLFFWADALKINARSHFLRLRVLIALILGKWSEEFTEFPLQFVQKKVTYTYKIQKRAKTKNKLFTGTFVSFGQISPFLRKEEKVETNNFARKCFPPLLF